MQIIFSENHGKYSAEKSQHFSIELNLAYPHEYHLT